MTISKVDAMSEENGNAEKIIDFAECHPRRQTSHSEIFWNHPARFTVVEEQVDLNK